MSAKARGGSRGRGPHRTTVWLFYEKSAGLPPGSSGPARGAPGGTILARGLGSSVFSTHGGGHPEGEVSGYRRARVAAKDLHCSKNIVLTSA